MRPSCTLLFLLISGSLATAEIPVSPGQSIQAAINAAPDGTEIRLAPGTYREDLTISGKGVRIVGSGPDSRIVGIGTGPVVSVIRAAGSRPVLDSVTVTGGRASDGGGIFVSDASPIIQRCVILDNEARDAGSGIYVTGRNSRPLIRNNILAYNDDPRPQVTSDAHQILIESGASAVIVNNTLVRGNGNAILLQSGARPSIVINNVLAWNGSRLPNGQPTGRGICDFSGSAKISYNLFYRNVRSAVLTGSFDDFRLVTDAETAVNRPRFRDNLDGNPRFRITPIRRTPARFDPAALAPKASNPLRNAGSPARRFRDRDGNPSTIGHTGGPFAWQ